MAYDFPANPTENQEFTPPVGGQTYIFKGTRWLVKGIPPVDGGGSGSGIPEAPVDGIQYGRQDAAWTAIEPGVSDWSEITGKPVTFPPTLPIGWADVSGKPATFPPTLPIAQSDVTGLVAGQTAQDTAIAGKAPTVHTHVQSDVTGLVAAQAAQDTAIAGKAPTVHTHAQADVTNLTTDLGAKAPKASPILTGNPTGPTPAAGDSSASLATTSFVKQQGYTTQTDITNRLSPYAPLFSPEFTGDPKAPTPTAGDNDTSVATTAFVSNAVGTAIATVLNNITIVIQEAAPAHAQGKLWWNNANGNLYISYNDGTSTQWVQINSVGT
jgi:hypothetical protein